MTAIRPTAVAGQFYPAEPGQLKAQIEHFLSQAERGDGRVPKAVIAPHAGYVYSGPVAASAYARLLPARGRIRRVVLLGPSHRVGFRGLALGTAEQWASPLGPVPIDRAALESLKGVPMVGLLDQAHAAEHSLEVHVPFL
ncbi:MAG TPA: AmmeMemoRadiSam system protein B, partial [Candidatus Omnitrophota bacterium]|nr:AmmeMemoRadiSam system protein B [Candidatus Omnitrophota bacterium]